MVDAAEVAVALPWRMASAVGQEGAVEAGAVGQAGRALRQVGASCMAGRLPGAPHRLSSPPARVAEAEEGAPLG